MKPAWRRPRQNRCERRYQAKAIQSWRGTSRHQARQPGPPAQEAFAYQSVTCGKPLETAALIRNALSTVSPQFDQCGAAPCQREIIVCPTPPLNVASVRMGKFGQFGA